MISPKWQLYLAVGATVVAAIMVVVIVILGTIQTAKKPAENPTTESTATQASPVPIEPARLPQPIINKAAALSITTPVKYSFDLKNKTVAAAMPVYKIIDSATSQDTAKTWANRLGLTGEPVVADGIWRWQDQNGQVLEVEPAQSRFNFGQTISPSKPDSPGLTVQVLQSADEVVQSASSFLRDHGFVSNDLSLKPEVGLEGSSETPLTSGDFKDASAVSVMFGRILSDRNVYYQYGQKASVSLLLTKLKKIDNFYYHMPRVSASTNLFTVTSTSEAQDLVSAGVGVIVNYSPVDSIFDNFSPVSANLTEVELMFFDDGHSGYLLPFYLFSGTARDAKGVEKTVVVYLPALKQ